MKRYIWRAFCDFIWMLIFLTVMLTMKLPLDSALAIGVMVILGAQVIRLFVRMMINLVEVGSIFADRRQPDTLHKYN